MLLASQVFKVPSDDDDDERLPRSRHICKQKHFICQISFCILGIALTNVGRERRRKGDRETETAVKFSSFGEGKLREILILCELSVAYKHAL